ncbi:MAG: chaperone NapD [Desulfovibrionaceae bacterium]|nr:chaperone NapD [Desulfovibrionaceae bacterium]
MAIASLLLNISESDRKALHTSLTARQDILEIQDTPENAAQKGLILVVECPSDALSGTLKEIADLPGVLELNLVYANYEDDLECDGTMPCSPSETAGCGL